MQALRRYRQRYAYDAAGNLTEMALERSVRPQGFSNLGVDHGAQAAGHVADQPHRPGVHL
jgi:hypothetical protein